MFHKCCHGPCVVYDTFTVDSLVITGDGGFTPFTEKFMSL